MIDEDVRGEWEKLRAEREAARRRVAGAIDELAEKARDPFGLKRKFNDNPLLAAAIAAGAGALLGSTLLGRKRRHGGAVAEGGDEDSEGAEEGEAAPRRAGAGAPGGGIHIGGESLGGILLKIATPAIAQFLTDRVAAMRASEGENGRSPSEVHRVHP